jgi:transposase
VPINDQDQLEFAAFVGIDWADRQHVWALCEAGSPTVEQGQVTHTPEAVDQWAVQLERRFEGRPIAVALEQSRGALVFMLSKYAHLVLFPVHPSTAANYRKSFRPSGAKDDPQDASLLLDLLMRHGEQLRRFRPDTPETRTLQFLVQGRRQLVNEKTRYSNRLTAHLKLFFPQVLDWFDQVTSDITADFVERWPTLEKLQRARPATIRRFLCEHNSRDPKRNEARLAEIRGAVAATHDVAVVTASSTAVIALVRILREVRRAIAAYDQQIQEFTRAHPEFALFDTLPGTGPVLVSRLIAALGTQRERYQSAHEIQCYSGIAPVTERSGNQLWVHWRWSCPKFLRQTFHEWALHSIAQGIVRLSVESSGSRVTHSTTPSYV